MDYERFAIEILDELERNPQSLDHFWREVRIRLYKKVLEETNNNRAEAARILGLNRTTFLQQLPHLGIELPSVAGKRPRGEKPPSFYDRECRALLAEFFKGEPHKVDAWMQTENPLFGGARPDMLIEHYRGHKVLKMIQISIEENRPQKVQEPKYE